MPHIVIAGEHEERVDVAVGVPRGGTNDACIMACGRCPETYILFHAVRQSFTAIARKSGWTRNHATGWLCPACSNRGLAVVGGGEASG